MTRIIILFAAVVVIWPEIALAKCTKISTPWKYGRTVHVIWQITEGTPCKLTNNNPDKIQKIEIEKKPAHGMAGKDGPFGVAYKPKDGFIGEDSFIIAVTSNSNFIRGAGWVGRVVVRVISR